MNYLVISKISYSIGPAGVVITTFSPCLCPNNPFPIGEIIDNFPTLKSASTSETIL